MPKPKMIFKDFVEKRTKSIIINMSIKMKVELKQIIDELTDAINLPKGQKVSALVDIDKIIGWIIVDVHEDGSINPISDKKFNNIKELISEYKSKELA